MAATPYNKSRARTALSIKTGLLTKQATKKVIQGSFRGKKWVSFPFPFAVHIQFNPKRFFPRNGVQLAWHFCKTSAFFGPPTLPHVHNACSFLCTHTLPLLSQNIFLYKAGLFVQSHYYWEVGIVFKTILGRIFGHTVCPI